MTGANKNSPCDNKESKARVNLYLKGKTFSATVDRISHEEPQETKDKVDPKNPDKDS